MDPRTRTRGFGPRHTKRFTKLREKTGLPPVRFHDRRHGAAAHLIHAMGGAKNPAALKTVQEIIGHASARRLRRTCTPWCSMRWKRRLLRSRQR
ncbi:hypothetical protein EF847_00125 [Actinobacteria bacterium YIM 96077]|uniref:Tyr recombinase domain-containing protein n=1 Tax=Phytoactinopolyspora halophila TaxID=1981511 RepID=A0A329QSP0_9ACTN|nr:hypothetical protein EF847_00125 [Actinobacteria bacterium YIM 96077]RAW14689.1 hypothetical protein DPM12_10545 [Phytoactinopolyspora halophila]